MSSIARFLERMDRLTASLVGGAAVVDLAIWLYVGLRQSSLPDVLPIHYSSAGQVDRIGVRGQLYILPAIGLITLVLNSGLAYAVNRHEPQLAYLLLSVSVAIQLLLAGAAIQLIR